MVGTRLSLDDLVTLVHEAEQHPNLEVWANALAVYGAACEMARQLGAAPADYLVYWQPAAHEGEQFTRLLRASIGPRCIEAVVYRHPAQGVMALVGPPQAAGEVVA